MTDMGELDLAQLVGVSYGAMVFAIVILALAGFWVANRIERRGSGLVGPE